MPESKYEALFSSMLRMAGITEYKREHRFDAVRKWRFDFAFLDKKIAIECDGGSWMPHGGRHSRTSDYEKRNAATKQGWRVYYFDAELIKSGKALALMIEVLRADK